MSKKLFFTAVAVLAFTAAAQAQNLQTFWDFGRNHPTTTFEMFKADEFGDTFWFIDHDYVTADQRKPTADYPNGAASAFNGTYFEIERGINFWQDSALKDLSGHLEYDGSSWGAGIFCVGAKYFLHNADFSNTLSLYLMYDYHIGVGSADIPIKFSWVWGMSDLFGLKGLTFKGFGDIWGNNGPYGNFSVLCEPQLWMNLGSLFANHLDIGTEIELSYNFAGYDGFKCNPCAGLRWTF